MTSPPSMFFLTGSPCSVGNEGRNLGIQYLRMVHLGGQKPFLIPYISRTDFAGLSLVVLPPGPCFHVLPGGITAHGGMAGFPELPFPPDFEAAVCREAVSKWLPEVGRVFVWWHLFFFF